MIVKIAFWWKAVFHRSVVACEEPHCPSRRVLPPCRGTLPLSAAHRPGEPVLASHVPSLPPGFLLSAQSLAVNSVLLQISHLSCRSHLTSLLFWKTCLTLQRREIHCLIGLTDLPDELLLWDCVHSFRENWSFCSHNVSIIVCIHHTVSCIEIANDSTSPL